MYRNVIDIHKEVPSDILKVLAMMADRAFDNRAGKVKNVSDCPYRFIYEGDEKDYGCLNLGMLSLYAKKDFVSNALIVAVLSFISGGSNLYPTRKFSRVIPCS